jgi:hypothetical protein
MTLPVDNWRRKTTDHPWLKRLRDVYAGLTEDPAPGGCPGDPSAWERDITRRAREREKPAASVDVAASGGTVDDDQPGPDALLSSPGGVSSSTE